MNLTVRNDRYRVIFRTNVKDTSETETPPQGSSTDCQEMMECLVKTAVERINSMFELRPGEQHKAGALRTDASQHHSAL